LADSHSIFRLATWSSGCRGRVDAVRWTTHDTGQRVRSTDVELDRLPEPGHRSDIPLIANSTSPRRAARRCRSRRTSRARRLAQARSARFSREPVGEKAPSVSPAMPDASTTRAGTVGAPVASGGQRERRPVGEPGHHDGELVRVPR
jgi:hypothetical protein